MRFVKMYLKNFIKTLFVTIFAFLAVSLFIVFILFIDYIDSQYGLVPTLAVFFVVLPLFVSLLVTLYQRDVEGR